MNWQRIEGSWQQLKGRVKEQWGKLTDDEILQIGGKRDQLIGKLRERYGWARERAEAEISRFATNCGYGREQRKEADSRKEGSPDSAERGSSIDYPGQW